MCGAELKRGPRVADELGQPQEHGAACEHAERRERRPARIDERGHGGEHEEYGKAAGDEDRKHGTGRLMSGGLQGAGPGNGGQGSGKSSPDPGGIPASEVGYDYLILRRLELKVFSYGLHQVGRIIFLNQFRFKGRFAEDILSMGV